MGESSITGFKDRIEIIDVLRGFALAGILYAHIIIWYTGAALPQEIYFSYTSTVDYVAFAIFGAFVFGKFYSIFSFLFGLGFYLHFRRKKSGAGYFGVYAWRLLLLFIIGIIHHTFWRGDILAIYALLGLLLIIFRFLPPKSILFIAVLLIINLPTHLYDAFAAESVDAEMTLPMEAEAKAYYSLIENGGIIANLKENWNSWPAKIKYQLQSGRLLMTFGYFLLGFYVGRKKLFESIDKNLIKFFRWNKYLGWIIIFLVLIAWLMLLLDYVTLPEIEVVPQLKWIAAFLFSIYNVCVTIFYITGITLLFRTKFFYSLLKPLGTMGRMALTNYLLQTVFGLLLFYDFGLGFFDITSPAINVLLAVAVFYIQLKFSQWWLTHFKQGPVEWLWKSLTQFKFSGNNKLYKVYSREDTNAL